MLSTTLATEGLLSTSFKSETLGSDTSGKRSPLARVALGSVTFWSVVLASLAIDSSAKVFLLSALLFTDFKLSLFSATPAGVGVSGTGVLVAESKFGST